jgi:hypothetical protein
MLGSIDRSWQFCERCGRQVHPGRGDSYRIRIEAVADPAPPVFTEADLLVDFDAEFRHLVHRLSQVSAEEAMDQVHCVRILTLCVSCYQAWIRRPAGP